MSAVSTKGKGLTAKQQAFCEEYLVDLNATKAAQRAGYSARTAGKIASENLTKPDIQREISRLFKHRSDSTQITAERVLQELARIAFFDIRRLYDESGRLKLPHELDEDTARAIAAIEFNEFANVESGPTITRKKYKAHDKRKALELLGRHLGLFDDRLSGNQSEPPCGKVVFVMPSTGRDPKEPTHYRNDEGKLVPRIVGDGPKGPNRISRMNANPESNGNGKFIENGKHEG